MIAVCDFCGDGRGKILVANPSQNVHICENCVELCLWRIEKEKECTGDTGSSSR